MAFCFVDKVYCKQHSINVEYWQLTVSVHFYLIQIVFFPPPLMSALRSLITNVIKEIGTERERMKQYAKKDELHWAILI